MSKKNPEGYMRITEHLSELRKRLLLAVAGVFIAAIGGWFLVDPVLAWMQQPLADIQGARPRLNFQTIGAAFDMRIQISLWLGTLIACPWWIYQIGAFIAPGLRRNEKIYLLSFGFAGVILFGIGALSGVWVVPKAVQILNEFTPSGAEMLLRADSYISFFMRLVIAFGLSCLIPEILVALNFLRLIRARSMVKAWRWAVVLAFTFAAIANPLPTAWPMIIQAMGLLALYWVAVAICAVNDYIKDHGKWSWKALVFWKGKKKPPEIQEKSESSLN